ncbi:APC family permease [Granulicella arctica]|uniref:APA family basic amino acid/polyamine antiporter n=1 Tax=Granulicella arctica TaxID=940613 RepID=A0A7Y9PJF1_9BACT|nr:amino acid permease [Granulicella arctica]NYF81034.1 APA family basic amino acid/polyamine antiporter [Granulicella arctica]
MAQQEHELPRVLNATHATSIVVGIIIGSGIFLVPREMMAAVGSSAGVYAVWIVGGLLSLFGAMTYAEIAAARPRYGGEYAFLREAYGDLTGFLFMWTQITVAKPASLATVAAGLARVLGTFAIFSSFNQPAFAHLLWGQVFAIATTWLITLLNILGTRNSANVQLVLTWLKGLLIVVIAGFCFFAAGHHGAWHNFGTSFAGAKGGFNGFMIALVAALWAYDGWSDVTTMAGEVHRPQRSFPVALIGGVTIVGALYMLTNAAIQYVLPATAIAMADRPAADAMRLVAGHWGASLVSLGMAISIAATFVGSSLSGARVPFAAARDGLFFKQLAHVSPRFRTPSASLCLQAVLTSLLLLAIGRFQALFSLAIFGEWLFYALTASTIFVFRRRDIAADRPYSVWGYPVLPALFIAAAIVLLVFSFADQPVNSVIGSGIILLGIPLHYLLQRRRSARAVSL